MKVIMIKIYNMDYDKWLAKTIPNMYHKLTIYQLVMTITVIKRVYLDGFINSLFYTCNIRDIFHTSLERVLLKLANFK